MTWKFTFKTASTQHEVGNIVDHYLVDLELNAKSKDKIQIPMII